MRTAPAAQSLHIRFGKKPKKSFSRNLVQKVIAGCKTHKWPPTGSGRVGERDLCNLLIRVSPLLNLDIKNYNRVSVIAVTH